MENPASSFAARSFGQEPTVGARENGDANVFMEAGRRF